MFLEKDAKGKTKSNADWKRPAPPEPPRWHDVNWDWFDDPDKFAKQLVQEYGMMVARYTAKTKRNSYDFGTPKWQWWHVVRSILYGIKEATGKGVKLSEKRARNFEKRMDRDELTERDRLTRARHG